MHIRTNHGSITHRIHHNISKMSGIKNKNKKVIESQPTLNKPSPIVNEAQQMTEMTNFNEMVSTMENQRKKDLESFIKKNKHIINSLQPKNKKKFLNIVQRKFFK